MGVLDEICHQDGGDGIPSLGEGQVVMDDCDVRFISSSKEKRVIKESWGGGDGD